MSNQRFDMSRPRGKINTHVDVVALPNPWMTPRKWMQKPGEQSINEDDDKGHARTHEHLAAFGI
jgi:hypothetical protein